MLIKVVEDHIILRLFLIVSSQPPREVLWLAVVFLHAALGQVEHSIQQEGLCGLQAQHKLCGHTRQLLLMEQAAHLLLLLLNEK